MRSAPMSNTELLDTARGCANEIAEVNKEIASFAHVWAENAGQLKAKAKRYERLHRAALRGLIREDLKVAEKDATAHAAVEDQAPNLAEEIEELEGKVEQFKVRFKTLERRASNAQSVLGMHRDESKFNGYVRN